MKRRECSSRVSVRRLEATLRRPASLPPEGEEQGERPKRWRFVTLHGKRTFITAISANAGRQSWNYHHAAGVGAYCFVAGITILGLRENQVVDLQCHADLIRIRDGEAPGTDTIGSLIDKSVIDLELTNTSRA
jgi:hypothetical protein